MSTSAPKLTKKQKKGLAFRDRASGKASKSTGQTLENESNDLPVSENQDLAEQQTDDIPAPPTIPSSNSVTDGTTKKRKRDVESAITPPESTETIKPKKKRRKSGAKADATDPTKQRFILFLGE